LNSALRIIGIDPGLRLTGFGLIEVHGTKLHYITSGVVKVPSAKQTGESLAPRLQVIFAEISQLIEGYQPTQAAIEKVFVNVNPASTLLLGQARGAALVALAHAHLPVSEYTALQIKKAVVGAGHAAKEQVQLMVQRLLNLPGLPSPDAADALACAICHAHGQALPGQRVRRGRLLPAGKE
jgi:crossover junction endodeoxyribonuclease RuvC